MKNGHIRRFGCLENWLVSVAILSTIYMHGLCYANQEQNQGVKALLDKQVEERIGKDQTARVIVRLKQAGASNSEIKYVTARQPYHRISKSAIKGLQKKVKVSMQSKIADRDMRIFHELENSPIITAEINADALDLLQNHPNVAMIMADDKVQAMLSESGPLVNSPVAHDAGFTGEGVTVAVIDSGIDTDHPYLSEDIVWEECFLSGGGCPLTGGIRESGPGSAEDDYDHGTHVSGIITSSNSTYKGVAPSAGIVALKVLDDRGSGYISDTMAAIDWAISNKESFSIGVINMSLGYDSILFSGECDSWNPQFAQVTQAARDAGIILFAASGNSGQEGALSCPACLSAVVSVGAVYDEDVGGKTWSICKDEITHADKVTCFSNTASILDLLAPGSEISSTVTGGGIAVLRGTSMACPHAAAAAAVLLEQHPEFTPEDVETRLESTGLAVTDPRNNHSFPRIDLKAALNLKTLVVELPTVAREGDGLLGQAGEIRITEALETDLAIDITSDDITEVEIEDPTILLQAGETSVPFGIRIMDDDILDGTRPVIITATAHGDSEYAGSTTIHVTDNETAILSLDIPENGNEGVGVLPGAGLLILSKPVEEDVSVSLVSSHPGRVVVPEVVQVLNGNASASFDLEILENVEITPPLTIEVTATVDGWTSGSDFMVVHDNDPQYYVNDGSVEYDIWCTAPGNDGNDGLTPATPKATVNAILSAYDLEPGEVLAIDTGTYLLEDTIEITSNDQGDSTAPVAFIASPNGVTFDRQSTQSSAYVWHFAWSDYVQLKTAAGYQVEGVAQQWMKLTGGYGGVFLQGAEHCTIERVALEGNAQYGGYLLGSDFAVCKNSLIVNNGDIGLYASDSTEGMYINNTLANNGGTTEILLYNSDETVLRNNIIWAEGNTRRALGTSGNDPLKASDYNLFYLTGGAVLGTMDGSTSTTLLEWQTATGMDQHSLSATPEFVDPNSGDWHIQSTGGSYHDGIWQVDSVNSPALDAGHPGDNPSGEPMPNGNYVNIGAYGGGEQASITPPGRTLVLKAPNGNELVKGCFVITWLTAGTGWLPTDTIRIEYSDDNGQNWQILAASVPADYAEGYMGYEWDTTNVSNGPYFQIRVSSTEEPAVSDQSEYWFTVHNGPVSYYVNDGSTENDIWCSAIGDDSNNGTSPSFPMASIQGVISSFDLEPGDVVYIDTGVYPLDENIQVTSKDQGSPDALVSFIAAPNGVTFDRQSTQSSAYVWHFAWSDYVQLKTAAGYQVEGIAQQWMKLTGGYGGVFLQGAEHCTIERVALEGNAQYGGYLLGSDFAVCKNNLIVNNGNMGLYASDSMEGIYINNTLANNGGTTEILLYNSDETVLRNNIIWAEGNTRRALWTSGNDPLKASDYNLFYLTGGAVLGTMDGSTSTTLLEWQTATGMDQHSLSATPEFVDPNSEDWHIKSTGGSYHVGAWVADTLTGPGVDNGDPSDDVGAEPSENGGRINMGAYGGTEQASKSGDGDGDGLPDTLENTTCTDPLDADTDDDGISDGNEDDDHDGEVDAGETNPCNPDTDGDGVQDGTESQVTAGVPDPDGDGPLKGTYALNFIADQDPETFTDPLNPDSDGDGLTDGQEDTNFNGMVDVEERDPGLRDMAFDSSSDQITNLYAPFIPYEKKTYAGTGTFENFLRYVRTLGSEVVDEVACRRVRIKGFGHDVDPEADPEWYEVWLAQDTSGVVWLFQRYDAQMDVTTSLGRDNAVVWMPESPVVGQNFRQLGGDLCEVEETDATVPLLSTGLGPYEDSLKVIEILGGTDQDTLYFAPNIGCVKEEWNDGGESNGWDLKQVFPGSDFDFDSDVDGEDLAVFAADFLRNDCSPANPCKGDFDGDGNVDEEDLEVLAAEMGWVGLP